MRCVLCAEPLCGSDRDLGQTVCEVCCPREHTLAAMERIWGPKCPSSDPDCLLCKAWKFFESKGLVPATEDAL